MRRALLLGLVTVAAGCAGDGPPPPPESAPVAAVAPSSVLTIAGSGAATPYAARLAAAWERAGGRPRALVEESIGSAGGVRAAADGAVDLGLVARPLGDEERARGLLLQPIGREGVGLCASPDVTASGVTRAELVALYAGPVRRLDGGQPVRALLRDPGESANGVLEAIVPGLAAARAEGGRDGGRLLYHDEAMLAALAATPSAVGVCGMSGLVASRLPLKVLALDGERPSTEAVATGAWRATRVLAFVYRPDRAARVAPLLAFARSAAATALADELAIVPIADGAAR